MYLKRQIEDKILHFNGLFPVVLVAGARQVGKSTVLLQLTDENRKYITLDDPLLRTLAKEDPALFIQRFPSPLLIDEVQYAPELIPYLKMVADKEKKSGLFWLTGSSQFHIMKGVSESLSGRAGIIELHGFTYRETLQQAFAEPFIPVREVLQNRSRNSPALPLYDLYRRIWNGNSAAGILKFSNHPEDFYKSYVQTYVQKDIRDFSSIGDEMSFLKVLRACAARMQETS